MSDKFSICILLNNLNIFLCYQCSTKQLTPWSRVNVKNPKLYCHFHTSNINLGHVLTPHFFNFRFNFVLSHIFLHFLGGLSPPSVLIFYVCATCFTDVILCGLIVFIRNSKNYAASHYEIDISPPSMSFFLGQNIKYSPEHAILCHPYSILCP